MRILVTGGAGYIGSVVVDGLVRQGDEVVIIDDLRKGHRSAIPAAATFEEGDFADQALLDRVLGSGVDAVVHMAAYSLVGESVAVPAKYYRNNVTATLSLLDAMVRHSVKRFVFSSTAAVYGDPASVPITEESPTQPTNPYGETKLAIEHALRWYDQAYGIRYATLRYFNAAGATEALGEDHDPESHLIPLLLRVAHGIAPEAQIFGDDYPTPDGTCIRDYIHVSDLADAHIRAIRVLDSGSRIYNLGNGEGFSVKQVLEEARRVTGHPIPATVVPRRAGDPPRLVASSDKIRRELEWTPRFPDLASILESAWAWSRNHRTGYEH